MSMLVRSPRKNAAGFTLIELMIAIAIIGVLAAIAVPAFSNYLARARVSEAIQYAESCKTGYIEFYATRGALPANVADANCPTVTTDNVAGVAITGAPQPAVRITLTNNAVLPAAIRGNVIVLQPLGPAVAPTALAAGQVIGSWRCSITAGGANGGAATPAALDLVPAICRNAPV